MSGVDRLFVREPARAVDAFRVAYGLVILWWAGSFVHDAELWFSSEGFGRLGVANLDGSGSMLAVLLVSGVGLAGCGLAFSRAVRTSATVAFAGLSVLMWANPAVMNTGERLLVIYGVVLALAPAVVTGTQVAWPRLALQWQMCAVYGLTVVSKLQEPVWRSGAALENVFALEVYRKSWLPDELILSSDLLVIATYATLVVQASLAVLIWNRKLRPLVLMVGIGLHVSIEASMHVGMFSVAILLPYLLFWLHRDTPPLQVPSGAQEQATDLRIPTDIETRGPMAHR